MIDTGVGAPGADDCRAEARVMPATKRKTAEAKRRARIGMQ
jgi:hypothetical protein